MMQYTEAYKMHCAALALLYGDKAKDAGDLLGYIYNVWGRESYSFGYDSNGGSIKLNKLDKSCELPNNELRLKIDELAKSMIYAYAVDNKYLCIDCSDIEEFLESEYRDESDIFIIDFNVLVSRYFRKSK